MKKGLMSRMLGGSKRVEKEKVLALRRIVGVPGRSLQVFVVAVRYLGKGSRVYR
jgi:hypothetical protein